MNSWKSIVVALLVAFSSSDLGHVAFAADRWQERTFPPPNGGRLVFTITDDGNPACASYDGQNCLWGQSMRDIDFARVRPLVCGAAHRRLYGVTGFEDPKHWCNLALADRGARSGPATTPATPAKPAAPAGGPRTTDWSGWGRAAGVEYRYKVRWDPATDGPGKTVEAIYEVRNPGAQRWSGAVRSLTCQNTLSGSTDVTLAPNQTAQASVRGPNCGSASNPDIRPNVIRAGKFD